MFIFDLEDKDRFKVWDLVMVEGCLIERFFLAPSKYPN